MKLAEKTRRNLAVLATIVTVAFIILMSAAIGYWLSQVSP